MIENRFKSILALACITGIAAPASVFATNGMFLIGTGTKSRGMGGVGITLSHDVMTSAANPATMSQLKKNRFDLGGDIFIPTIEAYMGQEPYTLREESKSQHATIAEGVYFMPNLGAGWVNGDWSYGFTMAPVGGGGTRYNTNLFNCANSSPKNCDDILGIDLMVMNINPTIAYKINKQHSIGATLIIGIQQFQAYGLSEFSKFTESGTSDYLTNNGLDYSYGAGIRLGWLGKFMNDKLTLGAEFTSQTYMTKFDKYKELFAEQGSLNTPGNIGLGIAYAATNELLVAMDINYIMYSGVAAISNAGPNIGPGSPFPVDSATNGLGQDEGLGFNWSDQVVYKIGLAYQLNPQWELRGGWNYAKSPIDESTDILFTTVAPAIAQNHLTLGGTYFFKNEMELSFSYIHGFEYEQYGPTYINYEGGYTMSQDAFGLSFGMNF